MGLDCYIFTGTPERDELWYGRKTNAIHGWMQRKSGIPAGQFNCRDLPLTHELLDKLQADLGAGKLTPTEGFFFGRADDPDYVREYTQKAIDAARTSIDAGKGAVYTSWW